MTWPFTNPNDTVLCGLFYHHVSDDIGGFQNRLGRDPCDGLVIWLMIKSPGVFFFTLALFGFSCLSSLGLFANERILFMRERCDSLSIALFKSTLTRRADKIKRILFFLHLLHIEGSSDILCCYL
jgi:hypothetical protein